MGTFLYALHRGFAGLISFGRWIAPAVPWLAVAAIGAVLYHWTPIVGPRAALRAANEALVLAHEEAVMFKQAAEENAAALDMNRGLRTAEASQAVMAIAEQAQQCRAEVDSARRSASIIEKLIGEKSDEDPNPDGGRRLIDADELRNALKARS